MKEKIIRYGLIFISIITLLSIGILSVSPFYEETGNLIGYKFLENDQVVIWNEKFPYYFNRTSGIQFSNYQNETWTTNVLCFGYKHPTDGWKYDCADKVNFNWDIDSDNLTYVNITGFKDKEISGRTVRFWIRYHLGNNDTNLSVQYRIKNIGSLDIPYDLGFAWVVKDIKIHNDYERDNIHINNSLYHLKDDLNLTFVNMKESSYELYDRGFVRLDWNGNLNYKVFVEKVPNQYNSRVTLAINAGTLAVGQSKSTTIFWKDPIGASSIEYGNSAQGWSDDVKNPITFGHDITCGNGMVLLVGVAIDADAANSIASITYNGTNLGLIDRHTSADGEEQVEFWNLTDPDCGESLNVVVSFTLTNTKEEAAAGSSVYYNVHSINLSTITKDASNGASSSSINVPAGADHVAVDVIAVDVDPLTIGAGDNQVERVNYDAGVDAIGMSDGYDDDGTVNFQWSWTSDEFATIGVSLVPLPAPTWTVDLAVNDSQGIVKQTLNYTGTGNSNGNSYQMTVCSSDSLTSGYPGTCDDTTLCTSTITADGVQADCNYTTLPTDEGLFTAYGFLCDSNGLCTEQTNASTVLLPIYGSINYSNVLPVNGINVTANSTFEMSATACCVSDDADAKCGVVSGSALYNGSSYIDTLINISEDNPFYISWSDIGTFLYNVVNEEGDGNTESSIKILGDDETNEVINSYLAFHMPYDANLSMLTISIKDSSGSDYLSAGDVNVSICVLGTTSVCDFSYETCTLVNDSWDPEWTGDNIIYFNQVYPVDSDNEYIVLIETASSDDDSTADNVEIWTDTSANTLRAANTIYGLTCEDTSITEYPDIKLYGTSTSDDNPTNSSVLGADQCYHYTWTVNASAPISSSHRVAINFTSSYGEGNISSNQTEDRLINIISPYADSLSVNLTLPVDGFNITANTTFTINATVTCEGISGQTCGVVSGLARYNESSVVDTAINDSYDLPVWLSGGGGEGGDGTAWNISGATYSSGFDATDNVTENTGLFFKPDGAKMYVVDRGSVTNGKNAIYEYNLSTHWEVSSAILYSKLNISNEETQPTGIYFNESGNKMYLIGQTNDDVIEYTLSTPWDITTASPIQSFDTSNQDQSGSSISFNPDGDKMYVSGTTNDSIFQYSLSTAWDVSTATYIQNFSIASKASSYNILYFDSTGSKLFVSATTPFDGILKYDLSIPWNISSISYSQNYTMPSTGPNGIFFKPDGTIMYVVDWLNYNISQFDISSSSFQSNPHSCPTTLLAGESCNLTWTVNASGANNTHILIDVEFNSSLGQSIIPNENTTDIKICIGNCTAPITGTMITVTLNQPPNTDVFTTSMDNVLFNFTVDWANDDLLNCSLFLNDTNGNWVVNATNTTLISDNTKYSIISLNDSYIGDREWNVLCTTVDGTSDWGDDNFTFSISGDTCTCPGAGTDHTFDLSDACEVETCEADDINFTGTGDPVRCYGQWDINDLTPNIGEWVLNTDDGCNIIQTT